MRRADLAFVWKEEKTVLAGLAGAVPPGGTIVEIGTAMGGTAKILHNATRAKRVRIYTVDKLRDGRAADILKGTSVKMINELSKKFASIWARSIRERIDLLYIDGDHALDAVYRDFNTWVRFMKSGGTVVFHDYDPPERGGIAHLGVKVFIDALVRRHILHDVKHEYKMFSGLIGSADLATVSTDDCRRSIVKIGADAISARKGLFAVSIKSGIHKLKSGRAGMSSLDACYCIDYALKNDFLCLDSITHSFYQFRKWAEALSILEDAYGVSRFPDDLTVVRSARTVAGLSKIVAGEQLKIAILSLVLQTLVDWEP